MKRNFIIYIFIIIALVLSGCSSERNENNVSKVKNENSNHNSEGAESDFPITINLDNEEIIIEKKPMKILPLSLEVAEVALELVDPSRIVALTRGVDDSNLSTKSDVAQQIKGRIGAQVNIDPEEILSYDSDLLLLTKMFGEQESAEKTFKQLEMPILSFDSITKVDHFLDVILKVGEAVGENEKAESLVAEMSGKIESIQSSIPSDVSSPNVLILSEIGGDMGPFMMGPTNISYDLIKLAKATPAVDSVGLERSTPASIEQILKMDPDHIILLDFFGKGEAGFEELIKKPGWNTLDAVQNKRIKMIEAKYLLNPNVENVDGLKMMVEWIYK